MIKSYLPPFISNMPEFKELLRVQQNELDDYNSKIDDLYNQCFVNTATWGLKYWEQFLNIKTDVNKNIEFRRSTIIAKLRGQGTVTKAMLTNVAASYSNGEVEIIEKFSDYHFIVKFIGVKGVPPNMDDLTRTIQEIKPAHLSFAYEYTYLTWNEFERCNKTWDEWDNLNLTWNEFESYKED